MLVKKLLYQSWHRGTRENYLLLGRFAEAMLSNFNEAELKAYESLLSHEDSALFAWITNTQPLPEDNSMIRRIQEFYQCP